jgi:hypothetical protein
MTEENKIIDKTETNKKLLIEALKVNAWTPAAACRAVGISTKTYYRWMNEDEEFRGKVSEAISEVSSTASKVLEELMTMRPKKKEEADDKEILQYARLRLDAVKYYFDNVITQHQQIIEREEKKEQEKEGDDFMTVRPDDVAEISFFE